MSLNNTENILHDFKNLKEEFKSIYSPGGYRNFDSVVKACKTELKSCNKDEYHARKDSIMIKYIKVIIDSPCSSLETSRLIRSILKNDLHYEKE